MDILNHDIADKEELLKKYKLAINIGRLAILAHFGYVMVRAVVTMYELYSNGYPVDQWGVNSSTQLILNVIILALVARSYWKPYTAMLWLAVIYVLEAIGGIGYAIYLFTGSTAPDDEMYVLSMTVIMPLAIATYVVRGTIYARKYERLKRDIEYALLEGMYEGERR